MCTLVLMSLRPETHDTRTMRERMLAGDLYIADDPELAEASARALDLADAYNATTVRQGPLRRRLLEELLAEVGEGTEIRPPLLVDYGSHLRIGARCFANFGLVGPGRRAHHHRGRRPDRTERPVAHPDPSGRAGAAAGQVGGRRADHDRRQRLAGRG